jgi:hypothetical protein
MKFIQVLNNKMENKELETWLRETKAKNLSLEELNLLIANSNITHEDIYYELKGDGIIQKAQILFNQWNNPAEESPKVETEPSKIIENKQLNTIILPSEIEFKEEMLGVIVEPSKVTIVETEWQPKRGERVLVFDYENSEPLNAIYLETVIGCTQPFLVVDPESEEDFLKGNKFDFITYKHMKPLPIEQPKETDFKSKDLMYSEQDMIEYSSYSLKLALEIIDTRVTPLILTPEEWKKEENKKQ